MVLISHINTQRTARLSDFFENIIYFSAGQSFLDYRVMMLSLFPGYGSLQHVAKISAYHSQLSTFPPATVK